MASYIYYPGSEDRLEKHHEVTDWAIGRPAKNKTPYVILFLAAPLRSSRRRTGCVRGHPLTRSLNHLTRRTAVMSAGLEGTRLKVRLVANEQVRRHDIYQLRNRLMISLSRACRWRVRCLLGLPFTLHRRLPGRGSGNLPSIRFNKRFIARPLPTTAPEHTESYVLQIMSSMYSKIVEVRSSSGVLRGVDC